MELSRYTIYGLTVKSELSFPHWPSSPTLATECDVTIKFGRIDESWNQRTPEDTWLLVDDQDIFVRINDVGQFLISRGESVVYQPSGANVAEAWLYVEGVITGALLHQRQIWPLHASAVVNPFGTVTAFIGQRGVGKSTLLFELLRRQHPLVADDIAAITLDKQGRPTVYPGFPQGKLCVDAAENFGLNVAELAPIRNPERQKVAVPYSASFSQIPRSLSEVYLLERGVGETVNCTELKGIEKLRQLSDNTYRLELLAGDKDFQRLFRNITQASQHVKAFRLSRPSEGNTVQELANLVEQRWNQQA